MWNHLFQWRGVCEVVETRLGILYETNTCEVVETRLGFLYETNTDSNRNHVVLYELRLITILSEYTRDEANNEIPR